MSGTLRDCRILSLDGGAVRGFSTLIILKHLMIAVSEEGDREVKPCEYFSMIAGVGIGGIIALLLGRLRLSVSECMLEYWNLASTTLRKTPFDTEPPLFDAIKLRIVMDDIVRRHTRKHLPNDHLLEDPGLLAGTAETCVFAVRAGKNVKQCFRTYKGPEGRIWDAETFPGISISDAAVATIASEGLFEEASLVSAKRLPIAFLDKVYPLGLIDPTALAVQEASRLNNINISSIISIGSGKVAKGDIIDLLRYSNDAQRPWIRDPRNYIFASRVSINDRSWSAREVSTYLDENYREIVEGMDLRVYRRLQIGSLHNVGPNDFLSIKEVSRAAKTYLKAIQLPLSVSLLKEGEMPALHWAACTGNNTVTKALLVDLRRIRQPFINDMDDRGYTPLHWAAENGHLGVAQLLLDVEDIDINFKVGGLISGETASSLAKKHGHRLVVESLARHEMGRYGS